MVQNLGKTTRDTTHKTAIYFTRTGRWKRTVVIFRAVSQTSEDQCRSSDNLVPRASRELMAAT
jgi:hypothetical protein